MFSREVSDLTSFYLFLTSSENPNFAEFLDWLGMDKAVEFFKRFGGQNIEVPCLEELDKAIRYFSILETFKNSKKKILFTDVHLKKFGLSNKEIEEFRNLVNALKTKLPKVYKEMFRG